MDINDLKVGDTICIKGYGHSDRAYRRRLMALGLTRGVKFDIVRFAPLGCPMLINVRGSQLSLRKDEACALELERI